MDLENFKYLWLIPEVLSFDKTQIIFGFVLTYSYLWLTPKVGCTSEMKRKTSFFFAFRSICTTFAPELNK